MAKTPYYTKAESDSKFDKVTAENIETALGFTPTNIKNNLFIYPEWYTGLKIQSELKNGFGFTNFDPEQLIEDKLLTYTPYFVSKTGSDSYDGLSPETAKFNVLAAINAGAKLIYILPGLYRRDEFTNALTVSNDLFIIGIGKVQISTAQKGLTWTNVSGNVYSATRSAVDTVLDTEIFQTDGRYYINEKVADLAMCEVTPGSWFQNGSTFYVHRKNGVAPDDTLLVNVNMDLRIFSSSHTVFFKNLEFLSSGLELEGIDSLSTMVGIIKNCKVLYPRTDSNGSKRNGIYLKNVKEGYVYGCEVANQDADGINGHDVAGVGSKIVEIYSNVYNINNITGSNQCSTMHDGIQSIRIGCNYRSGINQVVADVNPGTQSLMIGCEINSENVPIAFYGADSYLFGCRVYGGGKLKEIDSTYGMTLENCFLEVDTSEGNVTIK